MTEGLGFEPPDEHGQQTGLTKAAALLRLRELRISSMAAVQAIEMAPGSEDGIVIVDGILVSFADGYGYAVTSPAQTGTCAGLPEVPEILRRIEVTDAHLDDARPQWAKDCPEANMQRRVGKAQLEAAEAMEELSLLTGENPRKGQDPGARDRMLAELGDTAVAALLGIQSQTKNTGETWGFFATALAKAFSRVPAPPCGCPCHGDTKSGICGTCCTTEEPEDAR